MTNLRYAIVIIGALSLLLGLSLGQNYFQQQRINQLESKHIQQPTLQHHQCLNVTPCNHRSHWNLKKLKLEEKKKIFDNYIRYNLELQRWEKGTGEYRRLFLREE